MVNMWRSRRPRKDIVVWEKGKKPKNNLHLAKSFIMLQETTPWLRNSTGDKYQVTSNRKFNKKVMWGKNTMYFKSKSAALRVVNKLKVMR